MHKYVNNVLLTAFMFTALLALGFINFTQENRPVSINIFQKSFINVQKTHGYEMFKLICRINYGFHETPSLQATQNG